MNDMTDEPTMACDIQSRRCDKTIELPGLPMPATHSHHDRALLANALRDRGHSIKADLSKTYRSAHHA